MFYLIDKPKDWTSFDVLKKLRWVWWVKKVWHTGTLDPFATGCLLIATGNTTKLISLLEGWYKRYRATLRIDGISETLDPESEIDHLSQADYEAELSDKAVQAWKLWLEKFLLSQTTQIPPRYSAVHIDGQRAYDLARKWREFELPRRTIEILEVCIHRFDPPFFDIELVVSSGTYIRSLAPTIWSYFGTDRGYLQSLDRLEIIYESCILRKANASSIEDALTAKPIEYTDIFPHIPLYTLSPDEKEKVLVWQKIPVTGDRWEWCYFLVYDDVILSLGRYKEGFLCVEKNNIS